LQQTQVIEELRVGLAAAGSVNVAQDGLPVPADVWRKVARRAARDLGRPIQTLTHDRWVHAILADWPRDEREAAIHLEALRRAVEAAARPN
jgi:phage tail sheath gpL-like